MLLLLVIGNTEVSKIKGITAAGGNDTLIKYTPPADAEFLFYDKPICIDAIPVTPEGNPTPGIITKASKNLLKLPILVIRAGSIIEPKIPYINLSSKEGGDIRKRKGVYDFEGIKEKSSILADFLNSFESEIMIAESIPGGTTTAMAVLTSLGFKARSSSSLKVNPLTLKEKVIEEAMERIEKESKIEVMEELGDPVLASISYISYHFKGKVYLAGGTQMLAVAAYLRHLKKNVESIITTKYVINDNSATFMETSKEIGVKYIESELDLSISQFKGIRDYENGIVKEGVGAGGAYYLARKKGFTNEEIVSEIDRIYRKMIK